jgi:hypothetical protein
VKPLMAALLLVPALAWAQSTITLQSFSTGEDLLGDLKHKEDMQRFGAALWAAGVAEGMVLSGGLKCSGGRGYYVIKPLAISAWLEKDLTEAPAFERQRKSALWYVVGTLKNNGECTPTPRVYDQLRLYDQLRAKAMQETEQGEHQKREGPR